MLKTLTQSLVILLLFSGCLSASNPYPVQRSFQWSEQFQEIKLDRKTYRYRTFAGAVPNEKHPTLPVAVIQVPVEQAGELQVVVKSVSYEEYPGFLPMPEDAELINENLVFSRQVERHRQSHFGKIAFTPVIRKGNAYLRVKDIEIEVTNNATRPAVTLRSPDDVTVSALNDGTIYKIAVSEDGIHKITYEFLRDELGLNPDNLDPRNISLLGDEGGMLPFHLEAPVYEDVPELAIAVAGEADGSFDPEDFILFYGQGAGRWTYNPASGHYTRRNNDFDTRNYYYLKLGNSPGKRIVSRSSMSGTDYNTDTFDDFASFEEDQVNLLFEWGKDLGKATGSGREWFGDHFKNLREYNYDNLFTFPNRIESTPIWFTARMALRALTRSSFRVEINGRQFTSPTAQNVPVLSGSGDNERNYAEYATLTDSLSGSGETLNLRVEYPFPSPNDGSEGWLDYVQVNVRRSLVFAGDQLAFRDKNSLSAAATTYLLSGVPGEVEVWDVTEALEPLEQQFSLESNRLSFGADSEQLREFVAFRPGAALPLPEAAGQVPNQNLHGLQNTDMVILYQPDFEGEAQRLAQHRAEHDDLNIALVTVEQVMNEFAAGATDPTAIRNFVRLLYERDSRFRYLLLFGDGSFDARDIYGEGGNFVPTFQSDSFNPLFAFPADDYFAILESNDPSNPLAGRLNIAVGRLPVNTIEEARTVVDKIINYDVNPSTFTNWRNQLVFVADDEDNGRHFSDVDRIADRIGSENTLFNLEKIYVDAFPQVSTPGGNRFPSVNEAINNSLFKGTLVVTYLGHGGPNGWAQERILNISDILSWENRDRLPIFITATCTFGGYDDVTFTTGGEEVILNPKGGAVALLTTTRAVFASSNATLTENVLQELFKRENGRIPTLGEAMSNAKNSISSSFTNTNSRKFTLLGDPSQVLAIPELRVRTELLNGEQITDSQQDTIRALQRITLAGSVLDENGRVLESFNGRIFPTVFDKSVEATTLGQDSDSPVRNFSVQKNVLFKGRSSVTNGRFSFTFVVPKDINYQFGAGKVSYYASDENQLIDAGGAFNDIVIGGADPDAIADDKGPEIDVFMNTEDFAFGGITDENPVLLVKLSDENGINVVGNSIGHDLEGTLDEDSQNTLLLNDFYESELDNYTRGEVRFPLSNLEEGLHNIRVKAWDVANNSSEGYTEFVVANSGEIALRHVLNYPNPFTDRTCFQFDHNIKGQEIEILVHIYTVSGRLVKTLEKSIVSDGAIRGDDCLEWDGKDDYGDQLARGIYLYKVKVRTTAANPLSQESDFEKLVILK